MGRHQKWRKLVKKIRRKRVRQEAAKLRRNKDHEERKLQESSPSYIKLIEEQKILDLFQEEEEERLSKEREEEWLNREVEQQKYWMELQKTLEAIRQDRLQEEERICQEWMKEQENVKKQKARIKELKEENIRKSLLVKKKIDEFILNGGDLPDELNISIETNPNKQTCPFFQKTGACRFKDVCSRNHIRPGASKVLLFPSFYTHFSLSQPAENEYGSDQNLECDDREMYIHFKEFFNDILPEFDKFGHVRQLKVCRNREHHLRGNVYVEYASIRESLKAYKTFQGRWYGGKQLNVEFCNIPSWKSAICGLSFKNRCPKGSLCNFLHVFINPGKMFNQADRDLHRTPIGQVENDIESQNSSRRWRWSESPENDFVGKENYEHKSNHNGKHTHRENPSENSRDKRRRTLKSSSKSRKSRSPSHRRKKHRRSRS